MFILLQIRTYRPLLACVVNLLVSNRLSIHFETHTYPAYRLAVRCWIIITYVFLILLFRSTVHL
jgi:hypothetical protein